MLHHYVAVKNVNTFALLLVFEPRFASASCRSRSPISCSLGKKKDEQEVRRFSWQSIVNEAITKLLDEVLQ